ncbi:hypothetical protein [Plesiomonas shigelloides]|uniref:hypothetical protein n=1 Tax=Plesiomonas shigelloides TaxID=703 RepID=UPI001E2C8AFE|nr:hypothetical protein [Plesiomonas shigelloides]
MTTRNYTANGSWLLLSGDRPIGCAYWSVFGFCCQIVMARGEIPWWAGGRSRAPFGGARTVDNL